MLILCIILILAAVYSYCFYFTGLSMWFYFLWVPLSIILSFLTLVLVVAIMFQYFKRTDPKGRFRHRLLHYACGFILLMLNVKVEIVGKNYVPKSTFVCYANHKSDLDPILIYYSLNSVCSAVGKKSLFNYPIIKQCKPVFGCVALDRENDREAAKSILATIKAIKEGLSFIIFPEGGIKDRTTEEMVSLRAGAYKLVTKTGAYLLPAGIVGSSKIKSRRSIFQRIKIKVIFHQPLSQEEYSPYNTTEIGQMVMNIINSDVNAK